MTPTIVFVTNVLTTWYLVGLIWMVQVVHYNLYDRVGEDSFTQYELDHNRLITPIVGPPMLLELATAAYLVFYCPAGVPRWTMVCGLLMILGIWLSTVFLQVPCHSKLLNGYDASAYRTLVSTNWIRTILWTLRGVLMGYLLFRMLPTSVD